MVGICNERFWVLTTHYENGYIIGRIGNDLERTDMHGLKLDDRIAFKIEHIYQAQEIRQENILPKEKSRMHKQTASLECQTQ